MKVKTLHTILKPGTRERLESGSVVEVSELDLFWFRRVQDGDAVVVEEEPKTAPLKARSAPREE